MGKVSYKFKKKKKWMETNEASFGSRQNEEKKSTRKKRHILLIKQLALHIDNNTHDRQCRLCGLFLPSYLPYIKTSLVSRN